MGHQHNVPFFDYTKAFLEHEQQILDLTRDVIRRGAFILQRDLQEFESALAEYVGVKHVIGVGNATDAIYMLARAIDLGPGDEVVFCTHTMVATAAGIHFTGATPVPCETGWDHEIDPASVERLITPKTKAIIPTQLNGRCADMDALRAICESRGLMLLEDSAQALGSKYKGLCAGTFGRGGVISFYPAKTLGCLGDGGCVLTNDDEVGRRVRLYRDFGRNDDQEVECWCMNSRLDNLQAAILKFRFQYYDQWIQRRRQIASLYQQRLGDLGKLVLPPGPDDDPDRFDIFQNYEIEANRRDDLQVFLRRHGVGTLIQWGGTPVHLMRKLGFNQSLPFTEELFTRLLMLPMNHFLSDDDVHYVCDIISQFYTK
ncbi:MAG: DegT/DnrJ/EryC1/StrS family aminotransferase [Planctomycetaceae bacterium]|nr:DegT/DnrJ/EryC1/StrS family aminotransferase [Planctomycetaceae bacterium]